MHLSRVLVCLGLVPAAGPGRGDHKKPQEIEGWGTVTDPVGDCTVKQEKGKLTITVPGGNRNLHPAINSKAPRVMQEIDGDFVATVKVTSNFTPGEKGVGVTPFNGDGLFLWKDDKNCVRLERNIYWLANLKRYNCYPPLVEYFKDGLYQNTDPNPTTADFFKGRTTHLRMERKGDKLTASYGHDGMEWTAAKAITIDLPAELHVGVSAVNTSEKPFAVEFAEFTVTPKK